MFAVLKTGGKQYTVRSGDVLRVEKLACEAGETIQFNDVLMVGDQIGAPFVAGAAVQATVIDQIKGDKTIHFVRRRRKHSSKRTKGHRQQLTLVRVTDILEAGADATGVKAAIGTGARPASQSALQGIASAATGAAGRVGSVAAATAGQVQALAGAVAEQAGSAVERVEAVAGDAVDRTQSVAKSAADTVTEAIEDATSTTTGKVAIAAAAVAGVAAIAAAVLGGTSATAEDADGASGDADSKE